MGDTVTAQLASSHRLLPENSRARMAKANLRKADQAWKEAIGHAIQQAAAVIGWSLKELAAAIDKDERQCARWMAGLERPQLDALFAVEALRRPLIIALAELAGDGVEIETVIRIRRRA